MRTDETVRLMLDEHEAVLKERDAACSRVTELTEELAALTRRAEKAERELSQGDRMSVEYKVGERVEVLFAFNDPPEWRGGFVCSEAQTAPLEGWYRVADTLGDNVTWSLWAPPSDMRRPAPIDLSARRAKRAKQERATRTKIPVTEYDSGAVGYDDDHVLLAVADLGGAVLAMTPDVADALANALAVGAARARAAAEPSR